VKPAHASKNNVSQNDHPENSFVASIDTYSLLNQLSGKIRSSHHKALGKTDQDYFVKNWFTLSKMNQQEVEVKNSPKHSSGDDKDGLSLFWLIILVVLILWLLGFLIGDFGALIHILLVIALILLILWLLRII